MPSLLDAADNVKHLAAAAPPTTELGTSTTTGYRAPTAGGLLTGGWSQFADEVEQIPDLKWAPYGQGSVRVFDKMRTDPQVAAILMGLTLPIRRYSWHVIPNGATEQTVTRFAEDIGLPVLGADTSTVGRTRGRFSHDDHLRHALLALVFGHMYFEQVGQIQDGLWRLRKLAPRMPHSFSRYPETNDTGGLAAVWQRGTPTETRIPVDRLVAYVWEREASNWTGRSLLRAMYGPWLVKQKLIHVDVLKHERNGMGIPMARQTIPETAPGALQQAQQVAEAIRAGEVAGATWPYGFDGRLEGVSGSLPDTLASIRYCDEAIARAALMMFMMLGQTQTGSRALGETMVDYVGLNQQAIADWYAGVTTAHVAEDWVDFNDGEQAPAPRVGYDRDEHAELSAEVFLLALEAGVLTMSDEDETWFREHYNLPPKGKALRPLTSVLPVPAPTVSV